MSCMETYEAWRSPDGTEIAFSTLENLARMRAAGIGPSPDWELLHTVEAPDWNSAMTKHHELMGFEPYKPMT